MSSAQGPRTAGMEASASDAGGRYAKWMSRAVQQRGRVMSSDQGPRTAGMRASASDAEGRSLGPLITAEEMEASS